MKEVSKWMKEVVRVDEVGFTVDEGWCQSG